jgi:hypothetical protein
VTEHPPISPPPLSDRQRALLLGLADGTLRGRRRRQAEEVARQLPDGGREVVERQQRVAHALAGGPALPPGLAERPTAAPRADLRRRWLAPGLAASAAAVALALVVGAFALLTSPGGPSSVRDVAALEARPALGAAPYPRNGEPTLLVASADGVAFPNWAPTLGWVATGVRHDRVGDRPTTTVYYEHQGHRIGYTVVSGELLPIPDGAERHSRNGVEVALVRDQVHGVFAVFERDGRTCVLSGQVLEDRTLVALASWNGDGTVRF